MPGEADDIKFSAKGELERLDMFNKAKAVAACAHDLIEIKKIPDIVINTVDKIKKDMLDLKDLVEDLKNNRNKYLDEGKKCSEAKTTLAPACYKHVRGDIK